jgi:hypothetical protein
MIEWTIRLGDVVSFLGFALGGLSVIFMMKNDIKAVALKLGFLEHTFTSETKTQNDKIDKQSKEIARFAELLTLMGRYEERFIGLQKQIDGLQRQADDLKHGRGYITSNK